MLNANDFMLPRQFIIHISYSQKNTGSYAHQQL